MGGAEPLLERMGRAAARLLLARIVSQVIAAAWLVIIIRKLTESDFGLLAVGLGAFGLFTVVGDAGVSWSLPRVVVADPDHIWSHFTAATKLRAKGAIAVAAFGVPAYAALGASGEFILAASIGGAIALASGVTETGYVALRSVGRPGAEALLLPGEQLVLLILGYGALRVGAGAIGLLALYVCTNVASAALVARHIAQASTPTKRSERLSRDPETRKTAFAFALLSLAPRAALLLLSLVLAESTLGAFALGLRPVEQYSWFVVGLLAPSLPMMHEVARLHGDGEVQRFTTDLSQIVVAAGTAVAVALVLGSRPAIALVAGADRFEGSDAVLAVLAVAVVTWPLRCVLGFLLLVRRRSSLHIVAGLPVGLLAPVVAALVSSPNDPRRAAFVMVVGELASMFLYLWMCGIEPQRIVGRGIVRSVMAGVIAGLALREFSRPVAAAVATVPVTLVMLDSARRLTRLRVRLEALARG